MLSYIQFLSILVRLNGLYDIVCSFSILHIIPPDLQKYLSFFETIHLSMFKHEHGIVCEHLLAYWLLTYGVIRLLNYNPVLTASTYFIEAICIANETYNTKTIVSNKGTFVVFFSLTMI